MKTNKYLLYFVLCTFVLLVSSCEPRALTEEDVFVEADTSSLEAMLEEENPDGYKLYTIHEFLDEFMTEKGDFGNDTTPYRKRSTNGEDGIYLFSVDTIPTDTIGIYLRGRVTTDDYSGNFYKSMVIQQAVSWFLPGTGDLKQQNLRLSVDMGSLGGMFQIGQEILIRCNGLAIGRYANQPQLCIPTYNNNIYASSAQEKVGWAPGRIPAAKFRNAVKLIGTPDQSKLIYDECTMTDLYTARGIQFKMTNTLSDMQLIRKLDARLVKLTNVHFTGQYYTQDGVMADCVYAHPDSVDYANVFAPTTKNLGYPQSRIIANKSGQQTICVSSSEYCKFANYFLPGAQPDLTNAVVNCAKWSGNITGILGWYCDNASSTYAGGLKNLTGKEWSLTPRGIPGIGIADIDMKKYQADKFSPAVDSTWTPVEFDPEEYQYYKLQ